jgi:hypothetical protein
MHELLGKFANDGSLPELVTDTRAEVKKDITVNTGVDSNPVAPNSFG